MMRLIECDHYLDGSTMDLNEAQLAEVDRLAEEQFMLTIESEGFDSLNSNQVTIFCAKLAARFATYAADANRW